MERNFKREKRNHEKVPVLYLWRLFPCDERSKTQTNKQQLSLAWVQLHEVEYSSKRSPSLVSQHESDEVTAADLTRNKNVSIFKICNSREVHRQD